jgi:DNA-binding response OmpR family regulator
MTKRKRALAKDPSAIAVSTALSSPTIVVFSSDPSLVSLVQEVCPRAWQVESCQDPENGQDILSHPDIRMVVVDDEKIQEQLRGWLLDRVRKFASQALLFYVAALHSEADEKRARSYQAQYYTSKPLDAGRTLRVLESFLQVASGRDAKATGGITATKRR